MITYLEKYNQLPDDVKQGISTPAIIAAIEELEKKYEVTLATVVMRVMVKDISLVDLPKFFAFEYDLDPRRAEKLVDEMQEKIFRNVGNYLGISIDPAKTGGAFASGVPGSASAAEPSIRSSNFFFSTEDEEEVKELAKRLKIAEVENEAVKQESAERTNAQVDKIINKIGFNFSSEELHQRFRKVIYTYVKGVRSRIDARQTLLKNVKVGGLGLNDALANKALKIADEIKAVDRIMAPAAAGEPVETPAAGEPVEAAAERMPTIDRDLPYDFRPLAGAAAPAAPAPEATEPKLSLEEINRLAMAVPEAPLSAPTIDKSELEGLSIDLSAKEEAPVPAPSLAPPLSAPMIMNRPPIMNRTRLEDVKKVPKLSGPVDELKDLDLVNFRRLNSDPGKAAAKIKEKLQLLEDETYEKRRLGIKAWRESPVNREYLSIGRESIASNRGVEDIIEARRQNSQETLSYSEFLAIMDFNKSIRF